MKNKKLLIAILGLGLATTLTNCQNTTASQGNDGDTENKTANEHLTMAVLYQQQAAEYRALCYQAFNIAQMRVEESTKMLGGMKPKAVIMDIDETVLDNSPYEAKCILDSVSYPTAWDKWMYKADAKPVPGALAFVKFVEEMGMQVYYVSNRKDKYRKETLQNLKDMKFPFASDDHLLLKTDQSSKRERWDQVLQKNMVILMIGDNLNDFSEVFEKKTVDGRFEVTDSLKSEFGKRFIVLPNAMYGEWENAFYEYDFSKTPAEKKSLRHQHLIGF
ncbi:MAG: 5'-nucleotidase, lipoprotein e(P4) family [Bacteroidales bacterium]|nr:5'-nucleotidase, lipoprotein e(P4) family [Bacteroidales bacterium]